MYIISCHNFLYFMLGFFPVDVHIKMEQSPSLRAKINKSLVTLGAVVQLKME